VKPEGSVSLKAKPVRAVAPGFVITKLMLTLPPTATVEAANDFVIVGVPGAVTVTVAVFEGAPTPDSFALIGPVVLFFVPVVVPGRAAVMVQLARRAGVPPVNVSRLLPVMTRLPPQVGVVPLGPVNPAGKLSVNETPVNATVAFGFESTRLRLVVPFWTVDAAPNDLVIV